MLIQRRYTHQNWQMYLQGIFNIPSENFLNVELSQLKPGKTLKIFQIFADFSKFFAFLTLLLLLIETPSSK